MKIRVCMVLMVLISILLGTNYYFENHGIVPSIALIEGTFVQVSLTDEQLKSDKSFVITFDDGVYYKYRPNLTPVVAQGKYYMKDKGVYIIDSYYCS